MGTTELNVVTGAFGYTGKYIAGRLLSLGKEVRTLTGHAGRHNPFGDRVSIAPFNFDNPRELVRSLEGAGTLYNTYWVRFPYGKVTFDSAIENTRTLIAAAKAAGVRKLVHISITNASEDSPLPYFRGKAIVERAIIHSGLSYAIIRPTVIFGTEDILINNITWILRRSPVFAVFGSGDYRLQPVFVEDVAEIAVSAGDQAWDVIDDAVGPEIYRFDELVRLIAGNIGAGARIVHLRPWLALLLAKLVGRFVRDKLITRDEVEGLMSELLVSHGPPTAPTLLSEWLRQNSSALGTRYASELGRHYR